MKQINIKLHFALILTLFVLSGCSYVHTVVNEKWPPLTTKEQQLSAINEAQGSLGKMSNLDLALFINEPDFKKLAEGSFKNYEGKLIGKTIGKVTISSLNVVKIDLKMQGVFVATDFEIIINEYKTKLSGSLSGISALSSTDKQVNIRPSLSYIHLNKLSNDDEKQLIGRLGKNAAIALVNEVLTNFIDNLNGAYLKDPISIPMDLAFAKSIKSGDIVGTGDLKYSSGSEIAVNVSLVNFVPYINEQGVMFLASRNKTLSSEIFSVNNDLDGSFKQYTDQVNKHITNYFDESMLDLVKSTSVTFNKTFIADTLNTSLEKLDITLQKDNFINLPEDKRKFQKEVRIGSARVPSCDGLRNACRGRDCDGPCRTETCEDCTPHRFPYIPNPACLVRSGACQAENVLKQSACATCKLVRAGEVGECQIENEVRVARCKANRELLRIVDDALVLVKLNGEFNVSSSTATANIKKLSFNNDLSRLTIVSSLDATANTSIKSHVVPQSIGHIACIFPFTKTLDSHIYGGLDNPDVTFNINHQEQTDGTLVLQVLSESNKIDINLMPPPFLQLISDPLFVMNCSVLTMAISTISGEELLRKGDIPEYLKPIFGTVSLDLKPQEFKLPIKPVTLGSNSFVIKVKPKWQNKTIGFTQM